MHRAVALTLQCGDDESFLPEKGIQISLCFFEQPNPLLDFSNILCLVFHELVPHGIVLAIAV